MKYYTINEEAAARAKEMQQISYAEYLAKRMCQELPKVYTKKAYSDFIEKWKPIVKHEDEEMNEPDAWQMAYM